MSQTEFQPFTIAGLMIRTTNENQQALNDITQLWQDFMGKDIPGSISNKADENFYCVYTDYEGDHTQPYSVLLGCKIEDATKVPEGLTARSFSGGKYEKFTSERGKLMEGIVAETWFKIWESDLDRTYSADFEVFDERARNPEDAQVDIFIGVN